MKKYLLLLLILIHFSCKENEIDTEYNIPSLYSQPVSAVRVNTQFEYRLVPVYENLLHYNYYTPMEPGWLSRYNYSIYPRVEINILKIPEWMHMETDSLDGFQKVLRGTPGPEDIGPHEIILEATNHTVTKEYSFQIQVVENTISMEFVDVPAGSYLQGHCYIGGNPENVDSSIDYDFRIMKYEVTNEEFRLYLEEALSWNEIKIDDFTDLESHENVFAAKLNSEYNPVLIVFNSANKLKYDGENFFIEPGFEKHPVTCVTINGAFSFAKHFGLEIPYEREWQKASRGNVGSDYSFGDNNGADISKRANYRDSGDPWDNGTTPVGYFNGANGTTDSKSPYGAYDMTGNVSEWAQWNQQDPISDMNIVAKGGDWNSGIVNGNTNIDNDRLSTWYLDFFRFPGSNDYSARIGFRCVKK